MQVTPSLLTAIAFLSFRGVAFSQVTYVDDSATGANDGTSWQDAFTDLQSALTVAGLHDEVWVARGTYKPSPALDRHARFWIDCEVYGGFDGTETSLAQRAGLFDETILSGDLLGDDGPAFSNRSDNSLHVAVFEPLCPGTLDGFIVRGGNANLDYDSYGGGLLVEWQNLFGVVRSCTFTDNEARDGGGGIGSRFGAKADVVVERCTFVGNRARGAGGGVAGTYPMRVSSCRFYGNVAGTHGGGLYNAVWVTDCLFSGNEAGQLGGGACEMRNVSGSTFAGNTAAVGGGFSGKPSPLEPTVAVNCVLWGNSDATGPTQSGQIGRGYVTVSHCIVQGWDGSIIGPWNYEADPLFRSPLGQDGIAGTLDDDLSVSAGSACIDNGLASPYDGLGVDALGRPRFVDSLSCGDHGVLDRGAIERQHVDGDTVFCTSTPTSLGVPAEIIGQCHAMESNLIFVNPVPIDGGPAFLLIGAPGTPLPFGNGFLCLTGPLRNTRAVDTSGNGLTFVYDPDSPPWNEVLHYGGTIGIQALFRDVAAGGAGFNFSSAMRILAVP